MAGAVSEGCAEGEIDERARAVLARSAVLGGLSPGDQAVLVSHLRRETFAAGEVIFREGQRGGQLYVVISGMVKIGWCAAPAPEKLLAVVGPSDVFGAESIFDPAPRSGSATAVTDVVAAVMDGSALNACTNGHPRINEQFMRMLARDLRNAEDHIADLNFSDVPGRTARQLLQLAERFGRRRDREWQLSHDLTQREMAQLVGASRESVNKALCEFAHRGWITSNGKTMVIHQTELLARRAH